MDFPDIARLPRSRYDPPMMLLKLPAAGLSFVVAVLASSAVARAETPVSPVPYPPADLVTLTNPARTAIIRHEIDASIDPTSGILTASDRLTVVVEEGGSGGFPFLLWKDLTVHGLQAESINGKALEVAWSQKKRFRPRSFWKRPPYETLGSFDVATHYEIEPVEGVAWPETLIVSVTYSGTIIDPLHPPKAAYARSFDTTAGLIVPEGTFLASSSFWIPTRPDDIYTFNLRTSVPEDWLSVSQGASTLSAIRQGRRIQTWDCPHPMPEIYFIAGPYREHHLQHGDILAQTFTYADTDSSIYNRYLRGTGAYFDRYEKDVGPYPFEKFALVENFWQSGFGMPSFTLLGDRVIRLPFILDTSYGHEILHNWWGNGVFVDVESGNWCEGLTTYGADYRYQEEKGPEDARNYRWNALKNYHDYVSDREDSPLALFRERHDASSQAIGYSKSMMVIHQVRRAVGAEAFSEGLRRFYRDFLWRSASWTDFFASFEPLSKDAGVWTKQWIDRAGAPLLAIESVEQTEMDGMWELSTQLSQGAGVPFRFEVPVRATGSGAGTQSGTETRVFTMSQEREVFTWTLPFRAETVEVDPEFEVLRRLHREEIPTSLSQVLGADTTWVVFADAATHGLDLWEAHHELFDSWNTTGTFVGVEESELPPDWAPTTATWYLGIGPAARTRLAMNSAVGATESGWLIDGGSVDGSSDWVVTGAEGDLTWAVISAAPDQVATVGRKVPHYGKYSYLVFDSGTATAKGIWPAGESPMRVSLPLETGRLEGEEE